MLTLAADARVRRSRWRRRDRPRRGHRARRRGRSGWGGLNARPSGGGNRYFADRLRELQLPVQGDDACESAYGIGFEDFPYRPTWLLCAGTGDGRAGPCKGDSGAPLVVGGAGRWLDVGVLSGGDGCATRGYFDLYARVDRISRFALGGNPTRQPDPAARPRIMGRRGAFARSVHARALARQRSEVLVPLAPPRRRFASGPRPRRRLPARAARRQPRRPLRRHGRQSRGTQHGQRPAAATTPARGRLSARARSRRGGRKPPALAPPVAAADQPVVNPVTASRTGVTPNTSQNARHQPLTKVWRAGDRTSRRRSERTAADRPVEWVTVACPLSAIN